MLWINTQACVCFLSKSASSKKAVLLFVNILLFFFSFFSRCKVTKVLRYFCEKNAILKPESSK